MWGDPGAARSENIQNPLQNQVVTNICCFASLDNKNLLLYTWLDQSIPDSDLYISGYEIIRRDRDFPGADGKAYGGVCFYVRSSVNFVLRSDLSVNELENLCIEIRKPNSKPFLIGTWYRPPNY